MPIYEYACAKCDHEFEVEQRITDDPVKTCPACRSRKVKRLISRTSFVLKGSGWYSDLYSSPGGKKSEEGGGADKAEKPDTADKAEKTDAAEKPAAKEKSDAKPGKKGGTRSKGGPKAAA